MKCNNGVFVLRFFFLQMNVLQFIIILFKQCSTSHTIYSALLHMHYKQHSRLKLKKKNFKQPQDDQFD